MPRDAYKTIPCWKLHLPTSNRNISTFTAHLIGRIEMKYLSPSERPSVLIFLDSSGVSKCSSMWKLEFRPG